MNTNPYAAPGGQGAPPSHELVAAGPSEPWTVGEIVSLAWERYREHWPTLTFATLTAQLLGAIPGEVAPGLAIAGVLEEGQATYLAVHVPMTFVGIALQTYFLSGLIRLYLAAIRGAPVDFADSFGGADRALPLLAARLLMALIVFVGLLLLLVPGVIAALALMLAPYYVVDRRLGPLAALAASMRATEGQRGDLFLLSLALGGIVLAGVVACCVGLVVAAPVAALAQALVYARISGTVGVTSPSAGPWR